MKAKLKNLSIWLIIVVGVVITFVFRQKLDDVRVFYLKKRLAQRKNQISALDKQAQDIQKKVQSNQLTIAEAEARLESIQKDKVAVEQKVRDMSDDAIADEIAALLGTSQPSPPKLQ